MVFSRLFHRNAHEAQARSLYQIMVEQARRPGSPSTVSTFEDSKWYYIGQKTTQFAFFQPEILERKVLVISFNDAGYVADTRTYGLEDGKIIDPVERITPTEGREFSIIQQLLGNLGRFTGTSK